MMRTFLLVVFGFVPELEVSTDTDDGLLGKKLPNGDRQKPLGMVTHLETEV